MSAVMACLLALPALAWAQSSFELRDYLNRTWTNEWVTFPASSQDVAAVKAGQALVDAQGKPTLHQLTQGQDGSPRLGLLANVPPLGSQAYRFDAAARNPASDIKIERIDEQTLRLRNSLAGITLTTKLQDDAGPVQSIGLASGKWIGGSRLADAPAVVSSSLRVIEQGPAMARVELALNFEGDKSWRIEAKITAHEPVVHLTETFNLGGKARWLLDLNRAFEPDQIYYRLGMQPNIFGTLKTWPVAQKDDNILFHWEPWLHWWERPRQGTWFGLYNSQGSDLLALAAGEADRWVEPRRKGEQGRNRSMVAVTQTEQGPQADFSLAGGQRVWILASLDKDASIKPLVDKPDAKTAPLPQQYQIKHGEFPLERIHGYTLVWKDAGLAYPRLYLTPAQLTAIREQAKNKDYSKDRLLRSLQKPDSVVPPYQMDQAVKLFIETGNERLGQEIARRALQTLQNAVDIFIKQETQFTLGFAPHHRRAVDQGISLADLVLGTDFLTPEEKQRIKAQVAFLGYTTVRDDYWSPERGFAANPNMTSSVMSFQVAAGSLIPDHPHARQWVDKGLAECDHQLLNWTDDQGGSLEAPHYSMATYNYLLGCYLMAHNAGFSDKLFHERIRKIGLMYARISTPPDPRAKGMRHLPPVGNTYFAEPSGQFAALAWLWQEKDPEFSAHMRWMFEQQGRWPEPGVGGAYAPLSMVRPIFNAADLPARAPAWGSKLFPGQGVVLHAHFPSNRETQLYLISGKLHAHYDDDSGSITFWGKGSPFVDDFGYNSRAPSSQHSMFTASTSPGGQNVMTTQAFTTSDLLDYTQGRRGAGTRQLALIKDTDPLGMNYLVMRDSLDKPANADWRLWLDVASVTPHGQGALAAGHWDVDLDIHMLTPEKVAFKTENLSIPVWGVMPTGKYGKNTATRIGLIADIPQGSDAATVLFPRLKGQPAPVITSLEQGKVVKVQFQGTTDYIFLSQSAFEHQVDGVSFSGTVGMARLRDGQAQLSLGAPGRIAHGSQSLEKPPETEKP